MKFYNNFIALCNKIGKTPSAVAVEIGLSKPTVNRWKNGSTPTDATARKVANYFGVSVSDLTGKSEGNSHVMAFFAGDRMMETSIHEAVMEAMKMQNNKKPATEAGSGLHETGYDQLSPENKSVIDSLIEKLLKSQSGE